MKLPELKKRFKNKYVIRIAAGVLTVAIAGTSYGAYTVYAEKGTATESTQQSENKAEAEEELKEVLSAEVKKSEEEVGKDETVYIVADNTGKSKEVIVSDWLKNPEGKDTLEDASDLKDIKNVKGDETFKEKDGKLTWAAKGKDIYYQGTTDKELPVEQSITYYLDGKEMSADEIAGKSGKVTIRFDYKNNVKTVETVKGKEHNVYVPFTVMTGMILDDSFSNVEVSSGKVVSDGDKQIVVGVAMPGLSDSLKVDASDFSEDVDIPEYIEVTADVKDFSLSMSMSVMMSSLMSGTDFDEMFELDALDDAINTLSDSSTQLADGSKELADGLDTLNSKMGDFSAGIKALQSGLNKMGSSSTTLVDGVTGITDGIATLDNSTNISLEEVSQGITQKTLAQVAQKEASVKEEAKNTFSNGMKASKTVMENQLKSDSTVVALVEQGIKGTLMQTTASLLGDVTIGTKKDTDDLSTVNEAIVRLYNDNTSVTTPQGNLPIQTVMASKFGGADVSSYTRLENVAVAAQKDAQISAMAEKIMNGIADSSDAQEAIANSVYSAVQEAAVEGALGATDNVHKAINDETTGTSLVKGSKQLANAIPALSSGVSELINGTNQIADGTNQLSDGIGKLEKGSNTLSEGMIKFDEEGIQKLADTYNGDVKDLVERIVAVMQAGSDYQAFSQVADGTTGSVKFITRTEGVNVKED